MLIVFAGSRGTGRGTAAGSACRDNIIAIVPGINNHAHPNLAEIVCTLGAHGPFLRLAEYGQKYGRQNRNNGNDDE
jgi:hypothetical protein